MGTGRGGCKAGTKAKKKAYKKTYMSVKRRTKDIDQIQDEVAALGSGKLSMDHFHDEDKAGGGLHFCVPCSRAFISAKVLEEHTRAKPHKKMLKEIAEPKYTQKEADAGAGASS